MGIARINTAVRCTYRTMVSCLILMVTLLGWSHTGHAKQPFSAWDSEAEWDISCVLRLRGTNLPAFRFLYNTGRATVALDIGRHFVTREIVEGEVWLGEEARRAVFKSPDGANGVLLLLASGAAFYEIRRSDSEPFARSLRAFCNSLPIEPVPKDI